MKNIIYKYATSGISLLSFGGQPLCQFLIEGDWEPGEGEGNQGGHLSPGTPGLLDPRLPHSAPDWRGMKAFSKVWSAALDRIFFTFCLSASINLMFCSNNN